MPTILPYKGLAPRLHPTAFVAPGVVLIGDVEIGAESSIWPGCVLRGDVGVIRIGQRSNIQDGTIIHVTEGGQGMHVGDGVTVGHMALLHDCTVGDGAFVGMRATLLDKSRLESHSMLAAGALLTQGKVVANGQIWSGSPAKFWRDITQQEAQKFAARADEYWALAQTYR
ncbi:MAG: gamma carbonic anhydrase family protein [Proteobacteria bacterium]|jgi:carbonic anhydrase/acetyltransferase-like protein (isoleucine patch superfamily)|nr:gamma carbonic anhydrase family protein [Alphaproteobacteria bacterium]NCC02798.1 gamma carbonic anhydrase family protein [Pseudomonadota bacterium]